MKILGHEGQFGQVLQIVKNYGNSWRSGDLHKEDSMSEKSLDLYVLLHANVNSNFLYLGLSFYRTKNRCDLGEQPHLNKDLRARYVLLCILPLPIPRGNIGHEDRIN